MVIVKYYDIRAFAPSLRKAELGGLTSKAASEHPVIDGPAVSTRQGYSWCGLRWLGPLARAAWRLSDAIYHCISPFHAVVLLLS